MYSLSAIIGQIVLLENRRFSRHLIYFISTQNRAKRRWRHRSTCVVNVDRWWRHRSTFVVNVALWRHQRNVAAVFQKKTFDFNDQQTNSKFQLIMRQYHILLWQWYQWCLTIIFWLCSMTFMWHFFNDFVKHLNYNIGWHCEIVIRLCFWMLQTTSGNHIH